MLAILLSATVIAVVFGLIAVARMSYKSGAATQKAKELEAANEQWEDTVDVATKARDAGRRSRDGDLMSDDGFKRPPP